MSELPETQATAFHSNLALGLHAFAQPLAILRAKLYPEGIERLEAGDLRQVALDSGAQVERLCTLFNYLQEIVLAQSTDPSISAFDITGLLQDATDGLELWFRDSGRSLLLAESSESQELVEADKERLLQAVTTLIMLAHQFSAEGDSVTLSSNASDDMVSVRLTSSTSGVANAKAEVRLALALVETNLNKQKGKLSYSLEPLEFALQVPRATITS